MGEDESDIAASLTVGPTSEGMVRILIQGRDLQLPLDFYAEEAEEIADELRAAAERARRTAARNAPATRDGRRRR